MSFADQVDMPAAATAIAHEVEHALRRHRAPEASRTRSPRTSSCRTCERVITWTGTNKKALLFLDGIDSTNAPMGAAKVPGYVQWKIDVPAGADSITATDDAAAQSSALGGSGSAAALELAVGPAGMPIVWTVDGDSGNETMSVPFSGAVGTVTATLTGLTPGPQYVMILNGGGSVIGRNIAFDTGCSLGAGMCVVPDMATGGGGGSGGCSCDVGGRGPLGGLYALLAALGMLALITRAARRRSR